MKIQTKLLSDIDVSRFQRMIPVVELDPPYQREGGIWKPDTSSTFIDSIINGLDIPKLYFERAAGRRLTPKGLAYQYAVIDGKQRLEAIIGFLDGNVSLPEDFLFFEDRDVNAKGMSLKQLEIKYPKLARRFFDYQLPIVAVTTDSGDLIEEMFQRLNAATSLNSAEKRNALLGPTRDAANELATHVLLVDRSPIKNARYKYRELAAKFLAIEHQLDRNGRILDTKANTLYDLFVATRSNPRRISAEKMTSYQRHAVEVLNVMASVFEDNDPLLASIGFRDSDPSQVIERERLLEFEQLRHSVSGIGEDDLKYNRLANARLREYNAFVQSTNDGRALRRRADILSAYLKGNDADEALERLDDLAEGELPDDDEG
jgi:hypothetical protein